MQSLDIETVRGDDDYFLAVVYEPDSTTIGSYSVRDITSDTIYFAVKDTEDDDSTSYEFDKDSGTVTEIEIVDAENGKYKVYWDSGDTSGLNITDYFYAVELVDGNSKRKTIQKGIFKVTSDVYRGAV
jgi:hypothetical protein